MKQVFLLLKILRNIIERCKIPDAIKLRKKLGYNQGEIMIREETSATEKVV